MRGLVGRGVELGMDDASAGAHTLDLAGTNDAAAADGIPMLERAVDEIGYDFHVAMAVRLKAAAARYPVLVDDAQRSETHMLRIVIVAKREGMARIEPVDLGSAARFGFSKGDHCLSGEIVAVPI